MKKSLSLVPVILILTAILTSPGCKKWEGRYYIFSAACETVYYQSTNESKFAVGIEVANEESEGIGAVFADWELEVYSEDQDLILKINRANYDTIAYIITVFAETPIPNSSYLGYPGFLNVLTGQDKDKWRVPGDIFNDETPAKLKFTLTILDNNGYNSTLSGELTIKHVVE